MHSKNEYAKRKSSRAPINPRDVTAVVLTRNEERNLPRALDSLPGGMRVLVVDHESEDGTAAFARSKGATVVTRPFQGFVAARRFALSQVQTPWTLMIDADEALDAALAQSLERAPGDRDGYEMLRTTYYCGRALRMWRGERLLRLFRTDRAKLIAQPAAGGAAELHERWIVDGPTGELAGTLLHFSYESDAAYREKYERYTATEAAGLEPSPGAYTRELLRAPVRFAWLALARGSVLDGLPGLRIAWRSALYPVTVRRKALRR